MAAAAQAFTVQEASYVVGRPRKAIDQAVDRGELPTSQKAKGRYLKLWDLRYLAAQALVGDQVTPLGRNKLYQAIRKSPLGQPQVRFGQLVFDMSGVDKAIVERVEKLTQLSAVVKGHGGQTPVLKGSDAPVHLIASLARGQGVEATLEDYPGLSRGQVEAALEYAKAYPKTGRPYPAVSLKRMISKVAESGVFDEETDAPSVSIDMFR